MDDSDLDPLTSSASTFHLPNPLWEGMQKHVSECAPEEACGLIAGLIKDHAYHALEIIPMTNILHRSDRYRMDPEEQFRALMHIESMGLDLVGIYHSHPKGPDNPSDRDIDEAYYPECAYLIWFRRDSSWSCKGFFIQNREIYETQIILDADF